MSSMRCEWSKSSSSSLDRWPVIPGFFHGGNGDMSSTLPLHPLALLRGVLLLTLEFPPEAFMPLSVRFVTSAPELD